MSDVLALPFTEARTQVAPREYVEASLRAIAAGNPKLNAFIHVAAEGGGAPLAGVPLAIKDNIVEIGR